MSARACFSVVFRFAILRVRLRRLGVLLLVLLERLLLLRGHLVDVLRPRHVEVHDLVVARLQLQAVDEVQALVVLEDDRDVVRRRNPRALVVAVRIQRKVVRILALLRLRRLVRRQPHVALRHRLPGRILHMPVDRCRPPRLRHQAIGLHIAAANTPAASPLLSFVIFRPKRSIVLSLFPATTAPHCNTQLRCQTANPCRLSAICPHTESGPSPRPLETPAAAEHSSRTRRRPRVSPE